jgi:uncharacterized protein (TIGR00730 family)
MTKLSHKDWKPAFDRVAIYCAADDMEETHRRAAKDLGTTLGISGVTIVFGGINTGLMKIVADAALKAGGKVIGIVPQDIISDWYPAQANYEQIIVTDVEDRMKMMRKISAAGIVLPGGHGTDEEKEGEIRAKKVSIKNDKKLGRISELSKRPIVIFDPNGFNVHDIKKLKRIGRAKGDERDLSYFKMAESVGEVFEALSMRDAPVLKESPYYNYPILQGEGAWGAFLTKRHHHKDRSVGADSMIEHFQLAAWKGAAMVGVCGVLVNSIASIEHQTSPIGIGTFSALTLWKVAEAITGRNFSELVGPRDQRQPQPVSRLAWTAG